MESARSHRFARLVGGRLFVIVGVGCAFLAAVAFQGPAVGLGPLVLLVVCLALGVAGALPHLRGGDWRAANPRFWFWPGRGARGAGDPRPASTNSPRGHPPAAVDHFRIGLARQRWLLLLGLSVFFLMMVPSVLGSVSWSSSLAVVWLWLIFPASVLIAWGWRRADPDALTILQMVSAGLVLCLAIAVIWDAAGVPMRGSGPLPDPNNAATLLAMLGLIATAGACRGAASDRPRALARWIVPAVVSLGIVGTLSRVGSALWIVGAAALLVSANRAAATVEQQPQSPISAWGPLALLVALTVGGFVARDWLSSGTDSQLSGVSFGSGWEVRGALWGAVGALFLAGSLGQQIWGQGPGAFKLLYPSVRTEFETAGNFVHADLVQLALEQGVVAAVLLLALQGWIAWRTLGALSRGAPGQTGELGVLLALCVGVAHSWTNFVFYSSSLLLLMGLGVGVVTTSAGAIVGKPRRARSPLTRWGAVATGAVALGGFLVGLHFLLLAWQTSRVVAAPAAQHSHGLAEQLEQLDRLEALGAGSPLLYFARGSWAAQAGRPVDADTAFARAWQLDTRNPDLALAYASFLWERGAAAAGERILRAGIDAVPDDFRLHGALGRRLRAAGRNDAAYRLYVNHVFPRLAIVAGRDAGAARRVVDRLQSERQSFPAIAVPAGFDQSLVEWTARLAGVSTVNDDRRGPEYRSAR